MNSSPNTKSSRIAVYFFAGYLLPLGVFCFVFNRTMSPAAASMLELGIIVALLFLSWHMRVYQVSKFLFSVQACTALIVVTKIVADMVTDANPENGALNPHIFVVILGSLMISQVNTPNRQLAATGLPHWPAGDANAMSSTQRPAAG